MIDRSWKPSSLVIAVVLCASVTSCDRHACADSIPAAEFKAALARYCFDCHDSQASENAFDLEQLVRRDVADNRSAWEKVVRKLESRQMPPPDQQRPAASQYKAVSEFVTTRLDAISEQQPHVGHVPALRRLNRTEYGNAIRDLLALEINVDEMLPADESSHGFDHITVGDLPAGLLTRYVQTAEKIARLAVGSPLKRPVGTTYRIKADTTQEQHVPGLPLGTRGGGLFRHTFPRSGEYEIQIRLTRDRNDEVEGLHGSHQMEILVDDHRAAGLTVKRPASGNLADFDDSKLRVRIDVSAGPHELGVTFVRRGASLEETKRQPLNVHFNLHRHPRLTPAIYEVSITGPFNEAFSDRRSMNKTPDTPSRRRIFAARPTSNDDVEQSAQTVLAPLARHAYRRPIHEVDIDRLLVFFRRGYDRHGFEAGVEAALAAILTSPHFLLKIEEVPGGTLAGKAYPITDIEVASRLSFFLWSSIPDRELLDLAERGELQRPDIFADQIRRMLADRKAENLATNFADQWLHLRNLESITPDGRLYPDFDENLRVAMRRETQLHVQDLIAADRSVVELLRSDHTYLNERLAKHYGIPHVYGSRFRRVDLPDGSRRGGLLRQGSILTVTSYATRTSPVIRGNWVLENILGAPTPPPPDDVPSLDDQKVLSDRLTVRERLGKHREDPSCASCHDLMDPVGFALENFDAVGRWRERDVGKPVDARGGLPDGSRFSGIAGLEAAILARPEQFVSATTEKLMTFALGRGVELRDAPAIRKIVRQAALDDYRFSTIVLGIAHSAPFRMRTSR